MAAIVHGRVRRDVRGGDAMIVRPARGALTAEILPDLRAAEGLWLALETGPGCLGTPYQRFGWSAAYLRATGDEEAARVAVLRDPAGQVRMLIPLVLRRQRGLLVARTVGDAHANFHLPLFAAPDAAAAPAEEVRAALAAAGRAAGIDVYVFSHQPRVWEGAVNPLAARGEPEASDAYGLLLGPDPEATVRRVFSADARKKLRSKEKRLVEAVGPVEVSRAEDAGEARAVLAAFYAQKSVRFAGMGIGNPYAPEAVRRFLDAAATGPDPTVELHALRVAGSGRILAVFGGAVSGSRFSGMMTSFDADPAVSRFSPGDLLLLHLVRDQTARGRRGFDLGIGEARYKASICDETIALVESLLPVSPRGHLFALVRTGAVRLKRRIKRDPRLFAMVSRLRALAARG